MEASKRYNYTIAQKAIILKKWREDGCNISKTARENKVNSLTIHFNDNDKLKQKCTNKFVMSLLVH